jgi:glycosyltransferase involved in cell wall biosynthesis
MPKYSIIIPSYNGLPYLCHAVETIISQNYHNYELILSDDNSFDGSAEFIDTITHPSVHSYHTPHRMSMTEHWEWALSKAEGDWLIFVGQDDGLQPYFFLLADILTDLAIRKKLRMIRSERAYYFYPGCDDVYGHSHVDYHATSSISVRSTFLAAIHALSGLASYCVVMPQMYTSSLFHRCVLDNAKSRQSGKIFVTHPQDANLAAIALGLERKHLYSGIPLGWVGTSPKSAGLAISHPEQNPDLASDYLNSIVTSSLPYCKRIGDFNFSSSVLYFWGAIVEAKNLYNTSRYKFFSSNLMTYFVISAAKFEIDKCNIHTDKFESIFKINNIKSSLFIASQLMHKLILCLYYYYKMLRNFTIQDDANKISIVHNQSEIVSLSEASAEVSKTIFETDFLQKMCKVIL